MIQIIVRMASITHVPHLFSMKHILLEENTASLSIQIRKPYSLRLPFLYYSLRLPCNFRKTIQLEAKNLFGADFFLLCHNLFLSYINYYRQRSYIKRCQLKITLLQILLSGILHSSILGPILFKIFINDLFFFIKHV